MVRKVARVKASLSNEKCPKDKFCVCCAFMMCSRQEFLNIVDLTHFLQYRSTRCATTWLSSLDKIDAPLVLSLGSRLYDFCTSRLGDSQPIAITSTIVVQ